MILLLRVVFIFVFLAMLGVTGWASGEVALWKTPRAVVTHPWFVATLADTYFAFLTFYCWVGYKEPGIIARTLWLFAILLLGNFAIAAYMLFHLFRLPVNAPIETLLLRER